MNAEKTKMGADTKMAYAIAIVGAIAAVYLFVFIWARSVSLKKNGVYTNAIIFDISSGAKGHVSARYEFKVNGKTYRGTEPYSARWDTTIYIGDSCRIIYDSINPKNNKLDKYYRRTENK